MNVGRYLRGEDRHVGTARTTQPQPPQRTEQEPVAWPCLIDSADFSENTITLAMQCENYKVSAGTHWLSTTPPQRKPLTDEEIDAIADEYLVDYRIPAGCALNFARDIEAAHGIKETT